MTEAKLPHVVSEDFVEVLGRKLKVVVLSDGRRVFEHSEELASLMKLMGFEVLIEEHE